MSRTFKDRPYWVRIADPKEDRSIFHSHWHFGRTLRRKIRVRDENKQPVFKEEIITTFKTVYEYSSWAGCTVPRYEEYKVIRRTPVYKIVEIGEELDCCVVESSNIPQLSERVGYRHSRPDAYTCTWSLDEYARNRPGSRERKAWHAEKRAKERQPLMKALKAYNFGEDIDGYDDENLNTRVSRHNGWWN